ncbi:MAG TPA: hypothetical protein VEB59_15620, partial [Gemmatimonadales bacterium]|nr:hypothetical protein [Gemmatimonadales bacterium]
MTLFPLLRAALRASLLAPIALLPACNGGDSGPSQPPVEIAKAPAKSGDLQVGTVGQALASPLQVLVTRDGAPAEGVEVEWTAGNDGSV